MIRAFIAITPPSEVQQSIETVRRTFAEHACAWRWVEPRNVHLTLKFLGNVTTESVAPIAQAMQQAVVAQKPFQLVARSLGCFPSLARPRILWLGLEDPQQALTALVERLETALAHQGFPRETRPFHPHLTLARTQKRIDRGTLAGYIQAYRHQQFGAINVRRIELFQSLLQPEGAVHTIIRSAALQS